MARSFPAIHLCSLTFRQLSSNGSNFGFLLRRIERRRFRLIVSADLSKPFNVGLDSKAWGVLEQRVGNLSAARRLFRSSLNINSQSYVTWMTWASLEEDQGNFVRAEEIRDLYFQQRTEVVDDASWVMGFFDIIDPALNRVKSFLNLDENSSSKANETSEQEEPFTPPFSYIDGKNLESGFNLDTFIREKLSLDPSDLQINLEDPQKPMRKAWRSDRSVGVATP